MFISKSKLVTMQAQLAQAGIDISRLNARLADYDYNLNIDHHKNFTNYLNAYRELDAQQCIGRYYWDELPPYITSWQIESMLYFRRRLVGFYVGNQLFILPFADDGEPNVYGFPTSVQPVTYNGAAPDNKTDRAWGEKLAVDESGKYNPKAPAVILFDMPPTYGAGADGIPRMLLNKQFVELQADLMTRIENNLETACLKIVFECADEKQAKELDQDIARNLQSGRSWIIRRSGVASDKDGTPYQTGVQLETQTLIECWQSINSIRCSMSGIRNGGAFEKKERAIQAELASDDIQSDILLELGLAMRKLFLVQLATQNPEHADEIRRIRVRINQASKYAEESDDPVEERETVKDGEKEEVKYK